MINWIVKRHADLHNSGSAKPELVRGYIGDAKAHTWVVEVTENGAPADLSGFTAVASVMRADGTVVQSGTITGNIATVQLPQAAYAYAGQITAVMRLVNASTGVDIAIDAIILNIQNAGSDTIIDPGTVVPSVAELLAQIADMETATANANGAADLANAAAVSIAKNLTNLFVNPAFESSGGGWLIPGTVASRTDGVLTLSALHEIASEANQTMAVTPGHIYYMCAQVLSNSAEDRLYYNAGNYDAHSGSNEFELLSVRVTADASPVDVRVLSSTRSGDISANPVQIKAPYFIDLTAEFGAGHEPSKEIMDDMMASANTGASYTVPVNSVTKILMAENDAANASLALKFDKSDVTFLRAWVVLGSLLIDTTAKIVTWAGTNAYYGYSGGQATISNKNTALSYADNDTAAFIYVLSGVLTIGTSCPTDAYLIGVLYNYRLYAALSNHKIYIDGEEIGSRWNPAYDIIMPATLYLANEISLWMYAENVMRNGFAMPKSHYFDAIGYNAPTKALAGDYRRIILTGTGTSGTTTMYAVDGRNGGGNILKSKAVAVSSKAKPTGKTVNLLVVGDSFIQYTYGSGILAYIAAMASADGNTINFKGSMQNNAGILCEGRGGWSEADYLTRYVPIADRNLSAPYEDKLVPSPFVFSTDDTVENSYFSMSEYLSTNSIGTVDVVMFHLGWNGGDGSGINSMITAMKLALPDAKYFVCMNAPAGKSATPSSKNGVNVRNLQYITLFDGRQAENIYLIPTHCCVHDALGVQNGTRAVVQFADLDTTTEIYNTGIHPTALGAKAIAYTAYNNIMYQA